MSDTNLIIFIGESVLANWKYILSSVIGLIGGAVAFCWFVSNLINKKEIRILKLELANQQERFTQFNTVMEQRILMLQNEADILNKKITSSDIENMEMPFFLSKDEIVDSQVAEDSAEYKVKVNALDALIEKTETIKSIIKSASAAF